MALYFLAAPALLGAITVWLRREKRHSEQRRGLRSLYLLSEEILAIPSAAGIQRQLELRLPRIAQAGAVTIYLHNRLNATLDPASSHSPARSIPIHVASGSPGAGVTACFHNKTLLAVSDTSRSPWLPGAELDTARVLFIPMLARGEPYGVLQIGLNANMRWFQEDYQAAVQHMGNQIGLALQLLEQQSVREQLFRSEKLAAAAHLISGVASELRTPLDIIQGRARQLSRQEGASPELAAIVLQSAKASDLLSHLVSFSRHGSAAPAPLDLNALLRNLVQFREQEWKVRGVHLELSIAAEALPVSGAASQLEQAFLDLFIRSEWPGSEAAERTIAVSTSMVARFAVVHIAYPAAKPHDDSASLHAVRGIFLSHGGSLRTVTPRPGWHAFEVQLPLLDEQAIQPGTGSPDPPSRQLTLLLVEPDPDARRHLIPLLVARGHRIIPILNVEEGADLLERFPFDAVLCSDRLPGANWVDLHRHSRQKAGSFILLTEGYDEDPAGTLRLEHARSLRKPVLEAELDKILRAIEVE
ncbi:MAG: hypothetical protein JJE04_02940 [Acidobacteriia bacterium]|nr:hypothetical protein [Terriglobia bacterium]